VVGGVGNLSLTIYVDTAAQISLTKIIGQDIGMG
jgi:hypothetical protein